MINQLQITEKAKKQINLLLEKEPKGSYFRVAVEGGGCSGFKYNFSIFDFVEPTSVTIILLLSILLSIFSKIFSYWRIE